MTVFDTPGDYVWTAPSNGTILVVCIGAGGSGGKGAYGARGGGGGGGGTYASKTFVSVAAGTTFNIEVGTGGSLQGDGGDSWFADDAFVKLVLAKGGRGSTSGSGGAPGNVTDCIGDTTYSGTSGSANGTSGGGTYNGGAGGKGGGPFGGLGGAPGTSATGNQIGSDGTAPGGGGGGGYQNGGGGQGANGGSGAAGYVEVDYVTAPSPGLHTDSFTIPGTSSWIAPADGEVFVECYGAGGGAKSGDSLSGGKGGAGGGAYASATVTVTKGTTYPIIVGAGGVGGGSPTSGTDSSFGSPNIVLAKAGQASTGNTGGLGGTDTDSIGDTKNPGFNGLDRNTATTYQGGAGGNGALPNGGAGGIAGHTPGTVGQPGTAPGGGGGGGSGWTGTNTGGNGANGTVNISYYLSYGATIVDGAEKYIVSISQIQSGSKVSMTDASVVLNSAAVSLIKSRQNLSIADRALPSWVPSGQESLFNIKYGTFNWKSTNTVNLNEVISNASTSPGHFVIVGDSISEGWTSLSNVPPYTGTQDFLHAWPLMTRDSIDSQYGFPLGGTGFVRSHSVSTATDPRWSYTNNWGNGTHYVTASTTSQKATFTSDRAGDGIAIITLSGGSMQVSVDGATSGIGSFIIPAGSGQVPVRTQVTGFSNTTHTIQITPVGGTGTVYLVGAEVFNSSNGIRVHNLSQGGSKAAGTGQPCWQDTSGGTTGNMLPIYDQDNNVYGSVPQAVFIMLGGNDIHAGTDAATISAAFNTIGEAFANANTDIIIIPDYHGSVSGFGGQAAAIPMYEALYSLVLSNDWPLIDADWLTGGYESLKGLNYVDDDYGHLNAQGAKYFGGIVAKAITQPV